MKISLREKHQAELTALHQQVEITKLRFQETEDSLRQEVAGLKRIIADLERKLGEGAAVVILKGGLTRSVTCSCIMTLRGSTYLSVLFHAYFWDQLTC